MLYHATQVSQDLLRRGALTDTRLVLETVKGVLLNQVAAEEGTEGVANDDGSFGFKCCCGAGGTSRHAQERLVAEACGAESGVEAGRAEVMHARVAFLCGAVLNATRTGASSTSEAKSRNPPDR